MNIRYKAKRLDNGEYVEGYYLCRTGRYHTYPKIFVASNDFEEPDQEYEIDYTTLEVLYTKDTIINSVLNKIKSRSDVGVEKYKTTLDRTDLTPIQWVTHAQEEAMDLVNYLERLKKDMNGMLGINEDKL